MPLEPTAVPDEVRAILGLGVHHAELHVVCVDLGVDHA
jgi:hypothetical protein